MNVFGYPTKISDLGIRGEIRLCDFSDFIIPLGTLDIDDLLRIISKRDIELPQERLATLESYYD